MSGSTAGEGTVVRRLARIALTYVALVSLSCVFLLPVAWMLSSSLHDAASVFEQPFRWVPIPPRWETYARAVTVFPFGRSLLNTLAVAVPYTVGMVVSSALVAYGFARLRFPARDFLFSVCLATMMLPGQVTMIPLYMLFSRLGWVDTFLPLIIPGFFGSPFSIFLLRQFFLTIPTDCDEAALLDGAGRLRVFWSVVLPQAKPALVTVALFAFIGSWNDFFGPLIYLNSPERATLTLGLNMMKTQIVGAGTVEWNTLMAASLLVMLPNVILFFAAQKHFIRGIAAGSFVS
ncbi:MAG: carbohydrate ABC transporter permease [Bacteroidota bacterium]|nr:carbohydrate ABC transporter permease [Bacteroidota bacterium]